MCRRVDVPQWQCPVRVIVALLVWFEKEEAIADGTAGCRARLIYFQLAPSRSIHVSPAVRACRNRAAPDNTVGQWGSTRQPPAASNQSPSWRTSSSSCALQVSVNILSYCRPPASHRTVIRNDASFRHQWPCKSLPNHAVRSHARVSFGSEAGCAVKHSTLTLEQPATGHRRHSAAT